MQYYAESLIRSLGIMKAHAVLPELDHSHFVKNSFISIPQSNSKKKKLVFVSGLPRSGTSALGRLINIHPDVSIYTELHPPQLPYSINDFQNNIVDERINRKQIRSTHKKANTRILKKSLNTNVVGDKRPYFYYRLPATLSLCSKYEVHVVNIFRNIYDISSSYQRRFDDQNDNWNLSGLSAVYDFNLMVDFFIDVNDSKDFNVSQHHYIHYIHYDYIFFDKDYILNNKIMGLCPKPPRFIAFKTYGWSKEGEGRAESPGLSIHKSLASALGSLLSVALSSVQAMEGYHKRRLLDNTV